MLDKMSEVLPKELTDDIYDIYWLALKNFDIDMMGEACKIILKNDKFFPMPARIVETIRAIQSDPRRQQYLPPPELSPEEQWRGRLCSRAFTAITGSPKYIDMDVPAVLEVMNDFVERYVHSDEEGLPSHGDICRHYKLGKYEPYVDDRGFNRIGSTMGKVAGL